MRVSVRPGFRTALVAAAVVAGGLWLASCATMSKEQCLAGDWTGQGYADGMAGRAMSRLGEHAEACAKHGIAPDDDSYRAGRAQGLRVYCTPANGFRIGRQGNNYGGVCPADLEGDFVYAFNDGRTVYAANQAVVDAQGRVDNAAYRIQDYDNRITARQAELRADDVTDEQRDILRNQIRDLRRDREGVEREWYRAQSEVDDAEQRARDVRYRFVDVYGDW